MGFFGFIGGIAAAVIVTPAAIVVAPIAATADGLNYVIGDGNGLKNASDVLAIPGFVYRQISKE